MTRLFRVTLALTLIAAATVASSAHEGATGVAKDRMDLMQTMSKDMKEIARRVNTNRDLAAIGEFAKHVHDTAPRIIGFFPEGSGAGITDAKPEIWQHWNEFQAKTQKLESESGALATIASSGDPKAIGAQFTALIRSCTGCHSDFRRGKADRY